MADTATKLSVKSEDKPAKPPASGWLPFENLRQEIDRLFDDFTPAFWQRPFRPSLGRSFAAITAPAVDLVEKEKAYEVTAELPGLDPSGLEVRVSNNVLTIKGEKQEDKEDKQKEYYVSERRYGAFQRSFELPQGVDTAKIEASFKNGILTVSLPKSAEVQKNSRKIDIKAG
ncbi:HSP20 family protein [Rhizobium mongolense subsp. loessense]|uniref:HSP20 family protein n=1 Tax=Rhizobium mongolense subsp. loessense TaxID=158890 RepID=A0A1G4U1U7_9HYPH|nr:Hsp20/alpha crystallin family protein [Rhizobium mongolense]SCW87590.1 HSP20 family protein [Rhizobium mongolense subsp. loessense]